MPSGSYRERSVFDLGDVDSAMHVIVQRGRRVFADAMTIDWQQRFDPGTDTGERCPVARSS